MSWTGQGLRLAQGFYFSLDKIMANHERKLAYFLEYIKVD